MIAQKEQSRRFQDEVLKYMEELRLSSYIVAHPPPEAAGFTAELTRAPEEELPGFSNAAAAIVDAGTEPASDGPGEVDEPAGTPPPVEPDGAP